MTFKYGEVYEIESKPTPIRFMYVCPDGYRDEHIVQSLRPGGDWFRVYGQHIADAIRLVMNGDTITLTYTATV